MNERIRRLMEQAVISIDGQTFGKTYIPDAFTEKFAELIIKECYEHCKGQMLPKGMAEEHGLNYNDGVMDCAIGLIQHFGVK